MSYAALPLERIVSRMRKRWPLATDAQISALSKREFERSEAEKNLRPITIHELAARWYSYEKVVEAIAAGKLRPDSNGTFAWMHVRAVDIGIAAMMARPHPDLDPLKQSERHWERVAAKTYS